ncbi:1,4-dihydroxy-2-naphthoate octaprenyltransferase [Blattabacterium cuenoti]|uniref:1,4-dihydroxy-2-naphthoate octaprenyltransferase n=1 Tax=Blattabacterium cuenoti TaxID=1653831 RepID=UPI00293BB569|nr:1,4-dihydroxy-2-naphthoate octaprenyltransferase [Blattabacterium cuenoti]
MISYKHWINAIRLHTLPLSISGITSSFIISKFRVEKVNTLTYILCIVTALLLQILANISNDYGDGIKGIDKFRFFGPKRMGQSGLIKFHSMIKAIILFSILSFISGFSLIYISLSFKNVFIFILFFVGIIFCIYSSITYSVGSYSYGSFGLGDFSVFIFFGILSVLGSYFLYTYTLHVDIFLLSLSIGLLNVAILNINNMRDINSDYHCGKYTIANMLGIKYAKIYHVFLITISLFLGSVFILLNKRNILQLLFIIFIFKYLHHAKCIFFLKERYLFNLELKKLIKMVFLYSIYMGFIN